MSNIEVGYDYNDYQFRSTFTGCSMIISDETLMEYLLDNQGKTVKQIVKMIVQDCEPDGKVLRINYIEGVA